MGEDDGNGGPVSDEAKRSLLRDHLIEAARLAGEIVANEAGDFGVDMGPAVPDLQTARDLPEVQRAFVALNEAAAEVGSAQAIVGAVIAVAKLAGVTLFP